MKPTFNRLLIICVAIVLSACNSKNEKADLEVNRQLVRAYHDVWTNGHVSTLDTILSPDFVCHFIGGMEWSGIEGAKGSISNHKKAFPDWAEEIVDMIVEGDKVVTRYKSTGTHRGNFHGLDSTGIRVTIYETSIYRIADGKIIEQWGFPDEVSLRDQLHIK